MVTNIHPKFALPLSLSFRNYLSRYAVLNVMLEKELGSSFLVIVIGMNMAYLVSLSMITNTLMYLSHSGNPEINTWILPQVVEKELE